MKNKLNLAGLAAIAALLVSPQAHAQQRAQYEALVATHAKANNVPEVLVHRVIVRESKYHPDLIGRGGTIGLMQIKLATARGLGYSGDAAGLRDPETNIAYGVKYLAGAYRAANSDHNRAVHYYASGYYYAAKRQRLERRGFPEPLVARAAPKEEIKPVEAAPVEPKQAVPEPIEAAAEPQDGAKPADADATPKQAAAKHRRHTRKLADAKPLELRPPASIPASTHGGANATKPR
jgi:hypothetical protein